MNRYWKIRECQPSDFNLLPGCFFELRDYLRPVLVHTAESRYNESEREQDYRGDSHTD